MVTPRRSGGGGGRWLGGGVRGIVRPMPVLASTSCGLREREMAIGAVSYCNFNI